MERDEGEDKINGQSRRREGMAGRRIRISGRTGIRRIRRRFLHLFLCSRNPLTSTTVSTVQTQLIVPDETHGLSSRHLQTIAIVAFSTVTGASASTTKSHCLQTSSNPQQTLLQLAARKAKLSALPDKKREVIQEQQKRRRLD